jgi:hypothetical protein
LEHDNTSPLLSSRVEEQFILDDQQLAIAQGGVAPISTLPIRRINGDLAAILGNRVNGVPHGDILPRPSAPDPDSSRRLDETKERLPKFKRSFSAFI